MPESALPAIDLDNEISFASDIPGMFPARQKRSVRIRDSFIRAGVEALNEVRLDDLTVSVLCERSGYSVGAFYTRFQDKDAYFRALRVFTVMTLEQESIARFNVDSLRGSALTETLEQFVDLMVDIFTSRFRGVMRESFVLILEPDDPWAPMRESALKIVSTLQHAIESALPPNTDVNIRCRFCFQLVVGALQTELLNDYHVFTTRDDSLRKGLKEAVCAYMSQAIDENQQPTSHTTKL